MSLCTCACQESFLSSCHGNLTFTKSKSLRAVAPACLVQLLSLQQDLSPAHKISNNAGLRSLQSLVSSTSPRGSTRPVCRRHDSRGHSSIQFNAKKIYLRSLHIFPITKGRLRNPCEMRTPLPWAAFAHAGRLIETVNCKRHIHVARVAWDRESVCGMTCWGTPDLRGCDYC